MNERHKKRFAELSDQLARIEEDKVPIAGGFDVSYAALLGWRTKARSLLASACGVESEQYKSFVNEEAQPNYGAERGRLILLRAVFEAAREDFEGGHLVEMRTLVQAEVFDSELEQARELFSGGFLLAAAVVAGVVLETTLRELCDRKQIPHGKIDKMNADLAKARTFNTLVQKRITALAGIRNSAAHGKPNDFTAADVDSMITEVERFVAEYLT